MFKDFIKTLLLNPIRSSKFIKNQLKYYLEFPLYYFKDIFFLAKSFFTYFSKSYSYNNKFIKEHNRVRFLFDINYNPQIIEMFLNIYEIQIRNVLIKYLKKGDTFIDIGANIGFISAIGTGLVGKSGQVHSFEPVPTFFQRLKLMAKLNKDYQIFVNNYALGEKPGISKIDITNRPNIGWNTMVPGFMRKNTIKKSIPIEVIRIDDYIINNNIKNISLIKIDVEGFEFPVLKGLVKFLEKEKNDLPPIIVEIVPTAYPLLNYKIRDIEKFMNKYSYTAFSTNGKYKINLNNFKKTFDVLFKQT